MENQALAVNFISRFVIIICCAWFFMQPANAAMKKKVTGAQAYLDAFKHGMDFSPPAQGVFKQHQPDSGALKILGKALLESNGQVRENIVKLLVDMSLSSDALTPKGASVLRNPAILELLVKAGMAKPDLGREAAMDALRKLALPAALSPYEQEITRALAQFPTEEAFLLVAKAKPHAAKALVERLSQLPKWKTVEAVRITRAALGDQALEEAFIAEAEAAKTGKDLARSLGILALIGTQRSLKTVAKHLRTPLKILVPGAFEKSVRLDVLEALVYNFPDQPGLYPNNILAQEDFRKAEKFCIEVLGVTYTTPPPPFLTYRGFPRPSTE